MAAGTGNFSVFNQGFAAGVTIRGVPLVQTHPGKVFWVGNGPTLMNNEKTASDTGNKGGFFDPLATLTQAISNCAANRGDIIFVKPGFTTTVSAAAGLVLSKAGVALVGLGVGSMRPTITLDTANTASITVTANNVTVSNFLFKANFLNIATVFSIANAQVATDLTIDSCEFRDLSVVLNFVSCIKIGTTANIADGLTLTNNRVIGQILTSVPANQTFCVTSSIIDRLVVTDNFVNYPKTLNDTAVLLACGALDLTNAYIARNRVNRPSTSTTGGHMISTSSTACSGIVADNYVGHLDNSAAIIIATGTTFAFFNNFSMVTGAADKSALINPVAV